MATEKQLAANRLNARLSTGPRTMVGKARSRRNAWQHGLTAETVMASFEEAEHYADFQNRVVTGEAPRSALERELLTRLASVLWRLRRAGAVEAGLFAIQSGNLGTPAKSQAGANGAVSVLPHLREFPTPPGQERVLAQAFLRISTFNTSAFDRLSRYEMALWKQAAQLILVLETVQSRKRGR